MATAFAAAEELAVGVCSQTICSSGFGLVSRLEDVLMEVSLQGAVPQNPRGGIGLARGAPNEKARPVLQRPPPPLGLPLSKRNIASNH